MAATSQGLGEPIPAFSLPRLDAEGVESVDGYLEGKRGGLVVFWSAVCSHCVRYDEYFNSFTARHPELGFIAIASRMSETNAQMFSAIRDRALAFPILRDRDGGVARLLYAQQTPRCYLIGPDRTLHYRGAIDNFKMHGDPEYMAWLEPAIASFLAGEPIARPETASFGCAIETVYYRIPGQL
jgi:peroxiredoxin